MNLIGSVTFDVYNLDIFHDQYMDKGCFTVIFNDNGNNPLNYKPYSNLLGEESKGGFIETTPKYIIIGEKSVSDVMLSSIIDYLKTFKIK